MPTYVVLMNWTDQGIRTARETVQRRDQADALAERHGARIEQVYWTVGPYDLVTIVEAPDDESHRHAARTWLWRQPEDYDASRLRPRRDVRDCSKTRLR